MLTETNHIEFLRREKDFEAQKQIIDIEMKKERDRIAFEQFQETETENAEKIKNLLKLSPIKYYLLSLLWKIQQIFWKFLLIL